MYKVDFHSLNCAVPRSLWAKELYSHIRLDMDMKHFYSLDGEYMECGEEGCLKQDIHFLG